MSWSYSGTPSASDNDEVRFLSGMTSTTDQTITDEEIAYCVAQASNNAAAAAIVCDYVANKYAQEADIRAGADGELSIKFSAICENLRKRAGELRILSIGYISPWSAAISVAEKESFEEDTDRVEPSFKRGQFDVIESEPSTTQDWDKYGARE